MKTKILFALALLAAVGMCDDVNLVMEEAEGYEVHLPNKEYYKAIFKIPKEIAKNATGDVSLKLGFYFVHTSFAKVRRVTVYYNITDEKNRSIPMDGVEEFDDDSIDGKELDLYGKCNKGCTVHLWFYADCHDTCVFDITSFFWARMLDDKACIFSNTNEPFMPLYEGSWSPYFNNPGQNSYLYFVFDSYDSSKLPVEIEAEKSSCSLVSGENVTKKPTKDNYHAWTIDDERKLGRFVEGPNYIGLTCKHSDELVRIRIGGAPFLVPHFILAALAFFAF